MRCVCKAGRLVAPVTGALLLGVLVHLDGSAQAAQQASTHGSQGTRERPNILFIFSDDHAYQAIGAYGSKINETPNIDRLAAEGTRFDRATVTNSICGPSRAVILTGKHSHLNGFRRNGDVFDGAQQTFPKLMQQAGYQTAVIGKWHLKSEPTGFDYYHVLIGQGPYYNPPMLTNANGDQQRVEHRGYTTKVITDVTLDWLKQQRDAEKPFMLMYQHKATHREWSPGPGYFATYKDEAIPEPPTLFDDYEGRASPASNQEMMIGKHMSLGYDLKVDWAPGNLSDEQRAMYLDAYRDESEQYHALEPEGDAFTRWAYQRYIKDYLRTVAALDDNIGRVLDYLEESGLAENTIVIYSSDQGFYLGEHGWFDKRWMYEESFRTPLIVRWPGVTTPGSATKALVQNLDFAQTMLDMAGVDAPEDMQGRSITPLLRGEAPDDWRESLYYHYYEYPAVHMVAKHEGVATDRYKLIHYYATDEWELFDLERDPHELNSVYENPAYEAVRNQLKQELARLREQYDVPANPQEAAKRDAAQVAPREVLFLPDPNDAPNPAGDHPNPARKPIVVAASVRPSSDNNDGVMLAQGGEVYGYALALDDGVPVFAVRNERMLHSVVAPMSLPMGSSSHVAGVLDTSGVLRLFIDGREVAQGPGHFILSQPADRLSILEDSGSSVLGKESADEARSTSAARFADIVRNVRVWFGPVDGKTIELWAAQDD